MHICVCVCVHHFPFFPFFLRTRGRGYDYDLNIRSWHQNWTWNSRQAKPAITTQEDTLTKGNSLENIWYLSSAASSKNGFGPLTKQWTWRHISPFTFFHSATTSSLLYHPLNCHGKAIPNNKIIRVKRWFLIKVHNWKGQIYIYIYLHMYM